MRFFPSRPLLAIAGTVALAGCTTRDAPRVVAAPPPVAVPTEATYLATAPDLRTLAAAAKASGIAARLAGPGPLTLFAPTDAAFARLAPGIVDTLLDPANRDTLDRVVGYHLVPGRLTAADLRARVAAGNGAATLVSVAGDPLRVTLTQGYLTLTDGDGNRSYVEAGDIDRANGVIHVVNGVLVPRLR